MRRTSDKRYGIKAGDLILVALVVAASVVSLLLVLGAGAGEMGTTAIVEVNGEEVKRIELGSGLDTRTYEIDGFQGPSVIEVKGGKVRMKRSTCRDKLCIGMGWVDSCGESIVCLPNRVVIRIAGERQSHQVDTVTE